MNIGNKRIIKKDFINGVNLSIEKWTNIKNTIIELKTPYSDENVVYNDCGVCKFTKKYMKIINQNSINCNFCQKLKIWGKNPECSFIIERDNDCWNFCKNNIKYQLATCNLILKYLNNALKNIDDIVDKFKILLNENFR